MLRAVGRELRGPVDRPVETLNMERNVSECEDMTDEELAQWEAFL